MQLFKKGKVKEVYDLGDGRLRYVFTDNISVFDKVIPTAIPHKGESLCRTSVYWMKKAEGMGIATDYLDSPSPREMDVKKADIIRDYSRITTETTNYLIPLEVISRWYVAGSLHDRIKRGRVDPKSLGLSRGEYGEPLPEPFIEFTTKLEKVDRHITEEEARDMAGLTVEEMEEIKEVVRRLDEDMAREVVQRGLLHVDGKKEFAFDGERRLMLVDTFGTADEDRWWDKEAYDRGEFIELSKEMVRQHYRKTGYYQRLMEAREKGEREPDIPPLPDRVRDEVSSLYIEMYERITGERWDRSP
ncbi:MAG: phosphoribosylaminoimidazolesuccinocarboxamide synthase [Thermoplasmata archaeon]|nr:phosphoribosylaminoimidazolesuccinocarboxamide synthase [Thermoplasmata archaeon]